MPSTEDVVSVFEAFEGDAGFLSAIEARFEDEMGLNRRAAGGRRPHARHRKWRPDNRLRHAGDPHGATAHATDGSLWRLLMLLLLLLLLTRHGTAVGAVRHSLSKNEQRGRFDLIPLLFFFPFARSFLTRHGPAFAVMTPRSRRLLPLAATVRVVAVVVIVVVFVPIRALGI